MVEEIIAFNKQFVENKGYEKYITNKYPDKKLAILSCMDTRLTELLPAALGLRNGDAKIIKNAGAVISHPFGSVIRSLLVAIYELGVEAVSYTHLALPSSWRAYDWSASIPAGIVISSINVLPFESYKAM